MTNGFSVGKVATILKIGKLLKLILLYFRKLYFIFKFLCKPLFFPEPAA